MSVFPQGVLLIHIHQLLRHLVTVPVSLVILVHPLEQRDHTGVRLVGFGDVPLEHLPRDRQPMAGHQSQELVVDAGRLETLFQLRVDVGPVREQRHHLLVLAAQQELHHAVLVALQSARGAQDMPELDVLAGGQRREHAPLVEELRLDVLDARQDLERGLQLVRRDQPLGFLQLVHHQLEPELAGLVLDDKEHLIMMDRIRERLLRGEQLIEREIRGVIQLLAQVCDHPLAGGLFRIGVWAGHAASVPGARPERGSIAGGTRGRPAYGISVVRSAAAMVVR